MYVDPCSLRDALRSWWQTVAELRTARGAAFYMALQREAANARLVLSAWAAAVSAAKRRRALVARHSNARAEAAVRRAFGLWRDRCR